MGEKNLVERFVVFDLNFFTYQNVFCIKIEIYGFKKMALYHI